MPSTKPILLQKAPGFIIIPNFLSLHKMDVVKILQAVQKLPSHGQGVLGLDSSPKWLERGHSASSKSTDVLTLQTRFEEAMVRFGNFDFRWFQAYANGSLERLPELEDILEKLNSCEQWFGTLGRTELEKMYNHTEIVRGDSEATLGLRKTKVADFHADTKEICFLLGASRPFEVRLRRTNELLFRETLPPGSMVVNSIAVKNKHVVFYGMPPTAKSTETSALVVFRAIRKVIPWSEVKGNVERAFKKIKSSFKEPPQKRRLMTRSRSKTSTKEVVMK